ncbi:SMP-30/gluconolactonase/LRE family protein [Rapidithrix thailandica]|uniref:SMP-30/gluconolactonase/LRE family protein n=1 Tax=Rapidithrix thailandica TaxID=413964 RepID=A0AAW9RZ11_9BACT
MSRMYVLLFLGLVWACGPSDSTQTDGKGKKQVELVLDVKAQLGEGAIWHAEKKELYWVDIEGRKLNIFNPSTKQNQSIEVGERIGTVVPVKNELKAIVALQNGIHLLNLENQELTFVVNPEDSLENNRFNDGKCDPAGRLWVGSLSMASQPEAAGLYRVDTDGTAKRMLDKVNISNGIIWSNDHKTLYYTDTPTLKIKAFDYDKVTGDISNERVIIEVPEEMGAPDGMTIDAEGKLWVAHWGGSCVGRWNPETGELMEKVEVPALNVTSCAFGDEDLGTLYITTASVDMNEAQNEQYPLAGALFKIRPGVKGVKADHFVNEITKL